MGVRAGDPSEFAARGKTQCRKNELRPDDVLSFALPNPKFVFATPPARVPNTRGMDVLSPEQPSPTRIEETFGYSAETPQPSPGFEQIPGFDPDLEHVDLAEFSEAKNTLNASLLQNISNTQKQHHMMMVALGAGFSLQMERQEQRREDQHNELMGAWNQTSANFSTVAHKLDEQQAQLAAMRLASARVAEANEKATTAVDAKLHAMSAGQQAMLKEVCVVLATLPPLPTPASQ